MATTQTTTRALLAPKPATTAPSSAPAQRTRPYKDFLTPALHRHFTHAALLGLGACYLTSIVLAPPSLLWIWNPISLTTIRALLLFIPCLSVFIVRVTNMHCGEMTTTSQADWALKMATGWKGWHTLGWYIFSAFFFGEVYISTQAAGVGLAWVDKGREYERARVNENPLFLRALFLCLAVAQTLLHLSRDDDRIPVPFKDDDPIAAQKLEQDAGKSYIPKSLIELRERLPTIGQRVAKLTIPGFAFTLPVYFLLLRPWFWPYFYSLTRVFFRSLPATATPTGIQHITTIAWQAITSALTLTSLWELSNAAFTIFVARPPLAKSGIDPLTSGPGSKDPNGSLLSGLKSKKEVPRAFAFWELSLICQFSAPRRKTIYTDVDRLPESTWTQISNLCIAEITSIQTRIQAFNAASAPPPPPQPSHPDLLPPQNEERLGLPRIADRAVVPNGAVTTTPPPSLERTVATAAKSLGQSPNAPNPLTPRAQRALQWSAAHGLNRAAVDREAGSLLARLLRSPVGAPFRQTFAARAKAVVLGSPLSRRPTIVHASRALSALCACSLREDDFGQVAKSIAVVVRAYVETVAAVEAFLRGLGPHWSDVGFVDARDRRVEEVEGVVWCLKEGLEGVLLAFAEYADSVGLTKKELREAKECVAGGGGGSGRVK